MRICQALISRPPAAASIFHASGDLVPVYLEGDKRFFGPNIVVNVDGEKVYVDYDGRLAHFNETQVILERTFTGDGMLQTVTSQLRPFTTNRHISATHDEPDSLRQTQTPRTPAKDQLDQVASDPSLARLATPRPYLESNDTPAYTGAITRSRGRDELSILITEVLNPRDELANLPGFDDAKKKEL